METTAIERVYVWELPVRLFHWLNLVCVTALCISGILIGHPLAIQQGQEASYGYWFGWVRFIHFVAAFIFFFNLVFRIYWGFVGNEHARWRNFLPLSGGAWKEIIHVLKVDILQMKAKPIDSVGHNALAGLTYFVIFLAFGFQCVTGFGMYASMSHSWLPAMFAWVVPLMGGDFAVRQWHHVATWAFILFAMVHVYLVFYHDWAEERGVLSSMAGGFKFIDKKKER